MLLPERMMDLLGHGRIGSCQPQKMRAPHVRKGVLLEDSDSGPLAVQSETPRAVCLLQWQYSA